MKNDKTAAKKATTTQEEKTMKKETAKKEVVKKESTKKVETKKEVKKEVAPATAKVETAKAVTNKEKKSKAVTVPQMTNSEMKKLFEDNGCKTKTKANDTSNVVYNTFGTNSRVLQQGRAYQLLLTNGHKKVKEEVVECDNNDVARFKEFYGKLSDSDKQAVVGYDEIETTKLSFSEMPRERSVKLTSLDLLTAFIKYMATFDENKSVVA